MKKYLVTGGTGFIGSGIVRALVEAGEFVRVLDDGSRGALRKLGDAADKIESVVGDVRDADAVRRACKGMDSVIHLAYVNGTEFFYSKPEIVLDVGVKGMMAVIDGCIAEKVPELVLASSSEVYQTPPTVPTDESVPLSVPDPLNPRYSYGGGKIISELMAINYGRNHFERVLIFRPHNVYGPDMGWEHVIPQFALRMKPLAEEHPEEVPFPIHGTGKEMRSFNYIDDFVDGVMRILDKGEHLGIYHIGTSDEVTMAQLAGLVGEHFGRRVKIVPGAADVGATLRRCPDIAKISKLGYAPKMSLKDGVAITAEWYARNAHLKA